MQLLFYGGVLLLVMSALFPIRHSDYLYYEQLMQSAQVKVGYQGAGKESLCQYKEDICKDIWHRGKNPSHLRICSSRSTCTCIQKDDHLEIEEELEDIYGYLLDEVVSQEDKKVQTIHTFQAPIGHYAYSTQTLQLNKPHVWIKVVEQQIASSSFIPEILVAQGQAEELTCFLHKGGIAFSARQIYLQHYPSGSL